MNSNSISENSVGESPSLLVPLIDSLKQTEESLINIEIIEGTGADEKTFLLRSTISQLSTPIDVHIVSVSAYLLREILNKLAKDEDKTPSVLKLQFDFLLNYNCFPKKELAKIQKVSNTKFKFVEPSIIIWEGDMTENERDELLNYSVHPFWVVAVYKIFNTRGSRETKQSIREQKIRNFLNKQKGKFTIQLNQFPQLIAQINNLITNSNRIVHDTKKYRPVGEALIEGKAAIPPAAFQEFTEFSELINEFNDLMENFKLKPIGKLNQIDEIISE